MATQSGLSGISQDISPGVKALQGINFAGVDPTEQEKLLESLDTGVAALRARYDNPNYFKVAAAFAKPQLGGFMASLGSAADVMGENVEQQRANELQVFNANSQAVAARVALTQDVRANQVVTDLIAKHPNKPFTGDELAEISRIAGPGSRALTRANLVNTELTRLALQQSTQAATAVNITTAAGKMPELAPLIQIFSPETSSEDRQKNIEQVTKSRPPQIDEASWVAMPVYDKTKAITDYAEAQRSAGMTVEEQARQKAASAPDRIKTLGNIRALALGEGIDASKDVKGKTLTGAQQMSEMLNKFGGNNPMEVFARAVSDGKLGETLRGFDDYARQLGMSEQGKNKFQILVKLLAENQVTLRGSAVNPTDAFTQMQALSQPGVFNSQNSLVTLTDLLAHGENSYLKRYAYIKENKIPYGQLEYNDGYLKLLQENNQKAREIATGTSTEESPPAFNVAKPPPSSVSKTQNLGITAAGIKAALARINALEAASKGN